MIRKRVFIVRVTAFLLCFCVAAATASAATGAKGYKIIIGDIKVTYSKGGCYAFHNLDDDILTVEVWENDGTLNVTCGKNALTYWGPRCDIYIDGPDASIKTINLKGRPETQLHVCGQLDYVKNFKLKYGHVGDTLSYGAGVGLGSGAQDPPKNILIKSGYTRAALLGVEYPEFLSNLRRVEGVTVNVRLPVKVGKSKPFNQLSEEDDTDIDDEEYRLDERAFAEVEARVETKAAYTVDINGVKVRYSKPGCVAFANDTDDTLTIQITQSGGNLVVKCGPDAYAYWGECCDFYIDAPDASINNMILKGRPETQLHVCGEVGNVKNFKLKYGCVGDTDHYGEDFGLFQEEPIELPNKILIKWGWTTAPLLGAQRAPDENLQYGIDAFETGDVLTANAFLEDAVAGYAGVVSNDAYTARFLYAVTRIAALWFDMASDGDPTSGLNDIGDILDALGFPVERDPLDFDLFSVWFTQLIERPEDFMPDDAPTGGELQDFLYDVVSPELEGAIDNLNAVSSSFNYQLTDLIMEGTTVEIDYGEVLLSRAAVRFALAQILIQYAYDLDVDIDAEVEDASSTVESFLASYPDFLTLTEAGGTMLNEAKVYLSSAADDLTDAINWIASETDPQEDDLINLLGTYAEDRSEALEAIALAKALLYGPTTVDDNDTSLDATDDTILNLRPFFAGAVNLRELLPGFEGDDPTGLLPDPTFGGVLVKLRGDDPTVLNADLDSDGTADILEELGSLPGLWGQ
jgi:hypothetical protein